MSDASTEAPLPDAEPSLVGRRILVFDEQTGLGASVAKVLGVAGAAPIVVRKGERFRAVDSRTYLLNPAQPEGIRQLCEKLAASDPRVGGVIDCWGAAPPATTSLEEAALDVLLTPMRLVHALSSMPTLRPLPVLLVARGTARMRDGDPLDPARALGLGPARVLPQEHSGVRVAHVDVDDDAHVARMLVTEFAGGAAEPKVAFRGGRRFKERCTVARPASSASRSGRTRARPSRPCSAAAPTTAGQSR